MDHEKTNGQRLDDIESLPSFLQCDGCPFPSHGFICWGCDGSCMRTRQLEIMRKNRGVRIEDDNGNIKKHR